MTECVYIRHCKERQKADLILNITSLRYRTAKEIHNVMRARGDRTAKNTLQGILKWMAEEGHLSSRARETKNRGSDPMEYRSMAMLRKSGG